MKKKRFRQAIGLIILTALAVLAWLLFVPAHYNVPVISPRPGMQYWQLSTGSRIAYHLLPAKGVRKPYPIIYLHGGPGGPLTNDHIRRLSPLADDGYDVYLYDQVGSGYSSRLRDIKEYTAERQRRDLAAIVQKTGAEKVILIGQSWVPSWLHCMLPAIRRMWRVSSLQAPALYSLCIASCVLSRLRTACISGHHYFRMQMATGRRGRSARSWSHCWHSGSA